MHRPFIIACIVCILCASLYAQEVKPGAPIDDLMASVDIARADRADAVVVGTITSLDKVAFNKMITLGKGEMYAATLMEISISVDEVVKGKPAEKMTFKSVPTFSNLKKPLAKDQQYIFFLTRTPVGYLITNSAEIMDTERLEQIKARVADNPVQLAFESESTLCAFGKSMPFTLTMLNNSDKPMRVSMHNISLDVFAYSTLVKEPLQFSVKPAPARDTKGPHKIDTVTIEAGEKYRFPYLLKCAEPLCMSLFTAESYLQFPVALRCTLTAKEKDDADINGMHSITTPWKTVMVGFKMPGDDEFFQEMVGEEILPIEAPL